MPNKLISQLPVASTPTGEELLVLEQGQVTKQITTNDLLEALWDAHGGIVSCTLQSETAQTAHSESAVSYDRTYRITYADGTYTDFTVPDGVGIKRVGYSESSTGITHNLRFYLTDGRAYPTDGNITWRDGRGVASVVETQSGRTHTYTVTYNYNLSGQSNQTFEVEDGVSISNITSSQSVGSLTNTITVTLDDGTTKTFTVDDGVGISTITASGQTMTINLTDGTSRTVTLPMMSVYVRYADDASGTNFGTTPRPYMGVLTTTDSSESLYPANYTWYKIKGEKGDTGSYIENIVTFGESDSVGTQPTTWYNDPSSLPYTGGDYIWTKTRYVLHGDTDTEPVSPSIIIIGKIISGGSGTGSLVSVTFNNQTYADNGTGTTTNIPMPTASEVGAIADPSTKSNGQVLTYDSSASQWVAANPATGNVNTVNNVGVTSGTTNIALKGTDIPIDSTPTANAVVITDSSGKMTASSITSTELGYLDNVSSNVQTQINSKFSWFDGSSYTTVVALCEAMASAPKSIYLRQSWAAQSLSDCPTASFTGFSKLTVINGANTTSNAPNYMTIMYEVWAGANKREIWRGGLSGTGTRVVTWVKMSTPYHKTETVSLGGNVYTGYLDASKNLYFFIPLNKDLSEISSASISTDTSWAIFCGGSLLLSNTTLASFGTISYTLCDNGVLVKVVPSSTSSLTARETVVVRVNTATLTLS